MLYRGCTKTKTRYISELFKIQMKIKEVQTGSNDSLLNGINERKKS